MQIPPPIADEPKRLAALHNLGLLDTPAEERFDRITRLAQQYFGVKIALICLVDSDRQWFKSKQGIEANETPRDISFCGHAIQTSDVFVVEDTLLDPRFADSPLVVGKPNIRFYAGYALSSEDGHKVATLCVMDERPRVFSNDELQVLRDLGRLAELEVQHGNTVHFSASPSYFQRLRGLIKSVAAPLSSRVGAAMTALFVFFAILLVAYNDDYHRQQSALTGIEQQTLQDLALVRGKLESALNAKLYLVQGLSGIVHAAQTIDEEAFQYFAEELGNNIRGIRSLQLAPEGVVRHVWPIASNKAAIGHDLMGDASRRQAAEMAIASRKLWIAGPLTLKQGGVALIGRLPIFITKDQGVGEHFWGFGTILVDLATLLEETGVDELQTHYAVAIRGSDSLGSSGSVFHGDASVFSQKPILNKVSLPAGSWELGAVPRGGWVSQRADRGLRIAASFVVAGFVAYLIYVLLRLPARLRLAIRRTNSALERSETRFRDAIDAQPDGFVVYDADDRLALSNEKIREFYHASRHALQSGLSFKQFLTAGVEQEQYLLADNVDPDGFVLSELERHHKADAMSEVQLADGRWIAIVERKMRDGGRVGFHRDISSLKLKEAQLVEAKVVAESANQAKSDFLATISHELRTPLNGVLGLLGMLCDDKSLSDEQQQYATTANDSARQLLSILNELLDISKMEAGKLELDRESFYLNDTIASSYELLKSRAEAKDLHFTIDVDEALCVPLVGDQGRIRQVLLNLLSNALKFTDRGGVTLRAYVCATSVKDVSLKIEVSDTGIGFKDSDIESLFMPFSQLDASADRRYSGTGLGLVICKRLINMMGGDITATGVEGKGAIFTVSLTLPRGEVTASAPAAIVTDSLLPRELAWPTIRVLLAEDGVTNQLVIQAMLKNTGYTVDIAHDGEEAIKAVTDFSYDLILMDIYMPNVDGIAATEGIRRLPKGKDLIIIALTANAMAGDKERFIAAGMDDYLAKPVDKVTMLACMHKWIVRKREGTFNTKS